MYIGISKQGEIKQICHFGKIFPLPIKPAIQYEMNNLAILPHACSQ